MAAARYEIVRQLACGGMAEVLLARRATDDGAPDLVVIKRVLPHLSQAEGFMKMFATESRIASQLRHPNIVAVLEVGEMDSLPFIAMERLDGADLLRLLQQCVLRRQQLGTAVAMAIIAGAARGLGYAHRARARDGRPLKIIHRDVSPHNLFVTRDGGVKLLDFGIAKSAAQVGNTSTGQVKGKISYMSPEQIRSKPLTARSDLWSLGVVLWESVAGEKLFTRDNDAATLHAILHDPIPRLSRADAPELDDIIAAILHRDPDKRIPTAEDIAHRLEQLLARMGHASLPKIIAQRVASLVPALNPELDAVKPAVSRNPEVVTFAVGPSLAHHHHHGHGSNADARGPHRKLDVAPAPVDEPASLREDEDPTLLEIPAPPPDSDYDSEATFDSPDQRPLVGENTDTHTIPMQRAALATGTSGPMVPSVPAAVARLIAPASNTPRPTPVVATPKLGPFSVPSRRATQMFSGSASNDPPTRSMHSPPNDPPTTSMQAPPPGPSPRVKVLDELLDESLTGELVRQPTGDMPIAPFARPAPNGAPDRNDKQRAKPRVPPPPNAALSTGERRAADATTRPAPPTKPPMAVTTPPRPSNGPPPSKPSPSPEPMSAPGLDSLFGAPPPKPVKQVPVVESLFAEPPPQRDLRPPAILTQRLDTLAAAEVPSTVRRPTQQITTRRSPWLALAAVGGLCMVAGLVVIGAYASGALGRAHVGSAAGSSVALQPASAPAAPTPVTAEPTPAPELAVAPAALVPAVAAPEPTPLPEAPGVPEPAPTAGPEPVPAPVAPPAPAQVAARVRPPATRVVAHAPAPHVAAPPPAPRVAPIAPAPVAQRAPARAVPSRGPLPDPFALVGETPAARPAARPTRVAAPSASAPTPVRAASPSPAPMPTPVRRPPSVRGGGIFTDL